MNPDLQAACEIADANEGQTRLKPSFQPLFSCGGTAIRVRMTRLF